MGANAITRGILIGGSLGAIATALGVIEHGYFISVGFGAIMGFLAGATHIIFARKRKNRE